MSRLYKIVIVALIILSFISFKSYAENKNKEYIFNLKRDLLVLFLSYPDSIQGMEKDEKGDIYLNINNNKILYDDSKSKTREGRFYDTDLQDTLIDVYPLEKNNSIIKDNDPGRARCYSFLKAMYGGTRQEIEKKLIYVPTYYGSIMFTKVNGASDRLRNALNLVGKLVESNNNIGAFVTPLSGTYNYRTIQDTGQLSPHAFGIAIDLVRNDADYWKWGKPELANKRIVAYPKELVEAFEEQGFVWGGKWAHYDILHFEYRPEIILKAKYFNNQDVDQCKHWYDGAEKSDSIIKIIEKIDDVIDN